MKRIVWLVLFLPLVLSGCGAKNNTNQETDNKPRNQINQPVNETNNFLVYQNQRLGFSLNLPQRWQSYKVIEKDDKAGYYFAFYIKNNATLNNGYASPFVVGAILPEAWRKMKNDTLKSWVKIKENNDYVFAYAIAQDDQGYIGFGESVPNQEYQGPLYDVTSIIVPSFTFIEKEVSDVKLQTYTNKKYGYSLDYPLAENFNIVSDSLQTILNKINISVVKAEAEDEKINLADLIFKRVKLLCDADGVEASISCPRYAAEPELFKTNSKLEVYKIIFAEQTKKYQADNKSTISSKNRAMYVVSLGGRGAGRLLLVVEPMAGDIELAENIALSVKKVK